MQKKIINLYLSFSFFFNLSISFFFATYVIFLQSKGMNLLQTNLINFCFMASIFVLELPTGSFADVFGRKKSIIGGCLALGFSMIVYFISESFWLFVLAEVIGAFGHTLISGAKDAWLVDSLNHHGHTDNLQSIFKKELSYKQIGVIVGGLIGAQIGEWNIALPWLFSGISMILVSIFLSFKLKEDYFTASQEKFSFRGAVGLMRNTIREGFCFGIKNQPILFLMLFSIFFAFAIQGMNMQWSVLFKDKFSVKINQLGFIYFGISFVMLLGNQFSGKITNFFHLEKDGLIVSQLLTAIGIIMAAILGSFIPVLIFFYLHEFGRGVFGPAKQTYLNKRITNNEKRATILSMDQMFMHLGALLGLLFSGYLAEKFSIPISWLSGGIILCLGILIFSKIKNEE